MKTYMKLSFFILLSGLFFSCSKEGPQGPAGYDANVIYSEWFVPSVWKDGATDWYFDAAAPDLTQSIVESGVVLAYISFSTADVYNGAVRPLPCYVAGSNWDFLLPPSPYGSIEFTNDANTAPSTVGNPIQFRFIAIPGLIQAKSAPASIKGKSVSELKAMPYKDVCKLLNIPE